MKSLSLCLFLTLTAASSALAATDALDEVNEARVKRGLTPFVRDEGLSQAASSCADYRAARLISGHVDDFAHVPDGSHATAAGCAAWHPAMGWGACCTYENYRHAGAAWTRGKDGQRYMHLFVR